MSAANCYTFQHQGALYRDFIGRTAETGPQYGAEWIIYSRPRYNRVHDGWRHASDVKQKTGTRESGECGVMWGMWLICSSVRGNVEWKWRGARLLKEITPTSLTCGWFVLYVALGNESHLILHRTSTGEKTRFRAPSSRSIRRPKENLGAYRHLRNCSSYSEVNLTTCSTIIIVKIAQIWPPQAKRTANTLKTKNGKCIALWVQNANCIVDVEMETTTTATQAGVS